MVGHVDILCLGGDTAPPAAIMAPISFGIDVGYDSIALSLSSSLTWKKGSDFCTCRVLVLARMFKHQASYSPLLPPRIAPARAPLVVALGTPPYSRDS